MLLKKTLGFRISFIAFGAILSACNAYISGQTSEKNTAVYSEFASTAPNYLQENSTAVVKN